MEWFCVINNTAKGPFSEGELKELVKTGKLKTDTLVWNKSCEKDGNGWAKAIETELADLFPPPPPNAWQDHASAVTDDSAWYYAEKGKRVGSFTELQMRDLIRSGKISYGTGVWKNGLTDWIHIENTEFLTFLQSISSPPLPSNFVNNSIVWGLASVPIVGAIIENIFYPLFEIPLLSFFIYFCVNSILCGIDAKRLKAAGHDTDKFSGWIFIVPIYLAKRAQYLKQDYYYLVAWIICFLLGLFV
jgi:hypothetical protein